MKLGSLIPEVNILCVKLQDSRPPQAIILKNVTFFVSGVCIFSTRTLPSLQNFEVQTLVTPLIPKILLPTPFNPKSPKKSFSPFCKGDEGMIEGVIGTSICGSICLESSAESREYMLTYF